MRSERAADPGEHPRKARGRSTCPASAQRTIPDIFKVAVRGLGRLLLRGQVQLFRKLPQSSPMKDPCRRTQADRDFAFKGVILQAARRLLELMGKGSPWLACVTVHY